MIESLSYRLSMFYAGPERLLGRCAVVYICLCLLNDVYVKILESLVKRLLDIHQFTQFARKTNRSIASHYLNRVGNTLQLANISAQPDYIAGTYPTLQYREKCTSFGRLSLKAKRNIWCKPPLPGASFHQTHTSKNKGRAADLSI